MDGNVSRLINAFTTLVEESGSAEYAAKNMVPLFEDDNQQNGQQQQQQNQQAQQQQNGQQQQQQQQNQQAQQQQNGQNGANQAEVENMVKDYFEKIEPFKQFVQKYANSPLAQDIKAVVDAVTVVDGKIKQMREQMKNNQQNGQQQQQQNQQNGQQQQQQNQQVQQQNQQNGQQQQQQNQVNS